MATCKHPGCDLPQQERADGVGLGYCPEHRAARLRRADVGTIAPGPRGRGWRIKTETGWQPCDAQGRPLRAGSSRTANPDRLTPAQRTVLATLHRLVAASDGVIAGAAKLDKGTVSRRRDELARAGLVEVAVPRQGHDPTMWRCSPAGLALVDTFDPDPRLAVLNAGMATAAEIKQAAAWFDVPVEILGRFS